MEWGGGRDIYSKGRQPPPPTIIHQKQIKADINLFADVRWPLFMAYLGGNLVHWSQYYIRIIWKNTAGLEGDKRADVQYKGTRQL